jgi:hypothetical protein
MRFVSVREKILKQQRMISDEGVGKNTRGRVCSPCFPRLIALLPAALFGGISFQNVKWFICFNHQNL